MITFIRRFDTENIKEVIRNLSRSEKINSADFFNIGAHSLVDHARLAESRSIEDAIGTLKGSGYHGPLLDALPSYTDTKNSLILERIVDDTWWYMVERRCRLLGVFDSIPAASFLDIENEIYNINWIYRARFLLGLAPEKIPPHLARSSTESEKRLHDTLIAAQNRRAFHELVKTSRHSRIMNKATDAEISPTVFHVLCQRYLLQRLREMKALFPFSAMTAITLWKELELEVANLETVCECIFYGKKKEDVLNYLF